MRACGRASSACRRTRHDRDRPRHRQLRHRGRRDRGAAGTERRGQDGADRDHPRLSPVVAGHQPARARREVAVGRARVALGVGYVPERRPLFAGLTVRENLEASSSLPGVERRQRVEEMLALFPCSPSARTRAPGCCRAASSRCWRWPAP
jgi:hypothetical protein